MGILDGKVAIVTGAGRGIGREEAIALAKEGAKVVVNDLGCEVDGAGKEVKVADQVVEEIKNMGSTAVANYDTVSTPEGAQSIIDTAVKNFGTVDILVNNAGILRDKTLLKMTDEMWDAVLDVHLKGTFLCTRAAVDVMKERGGGCIINTTSVAGLMGNFGQTNYSAAKAGIYGLTRTWSIELIRYAIRVNAIAPAALTRMTQDVPMFKGFSEDDLGPQHVAPVVVFLASDLAKDINGKIIGVHGRHIFVYYMRVTDGAKKESGLWTPQEIGERIKEILGE